VVIILKLPTPELPGQVQAVGDAASRPLSPVGPELAAYALRAGVLLRPLGNVVYLLPPYCSTAADLAHAYDVIEQFLGWK